MIPYEIVTLPARRITARGLRTGNGDPQMSGRIGRLWAEFMAPGGREMLDCVPGAPCFGIYTNYHLDDESYDALVGCESGNCPDGFMPVEIPAGEYARFSVHGDVRRAVADAWREIWSLPLPRAFTVDFEEYRNCAGGTGDIDIYVALADICQSCGMPMTRADQHGTEQGGEPSREYCCYCRRDGEFAQDCTMEQMIDYCLGCGGELYSDRETARRRMMEYYPHLKRWRA